MSTERPKSSPSVGRKCGDPLGLLLVLWGLVVVSLVAAGYGWWWVLK